MGKQKAITYYVKLNDGEFISSDIVYAQGGIYVVEQSCRRFIPYMRIIEIVEK